MLFNKLVTLSAITTLAAATALPRGGGGGGSGSGPQCCQSVQTADGANSSGLSGLLTLLGVVVGSLTFPIGLNCSPITGIGIGSGNACSSVTVCCENNAVVSIFTNDRIDLYLHRVIGRDYLDRLHPHFLVSTRVVSISHGTG